MKVGAAGAESCEKPETACCAATKALWILMVVSRLKSAKESAKGSSAGVKVEALTAMRQSARDGTVGDEGLPL